VYKAPIDFVFFARYKNDNNIESLARVQRFRSVSAGSATQQSTPTSINPWGTMGLLARSIRKRRLKHSRPEVNNPDWLREHRPCSYWAATRRPFPSLLLIAPLILAYESGVRWLGGASAAELRTGADTWMRNALVRVGLTDQWFLPLGLFLILMTWQVLRFYDWRFSPAILAGMVVESIVWAVALIGISRLKILASALAVTGSALLFALAHHAGTPAESFTWFAFIFRWMAGVFFAWVFVIRGFGIAVGSHTGYDILVGYFGWRF
jgi:Type II CAAX prenyl endopeptidase Rce1-like